jgi:hypothetical protein
LAASAIARSRIVSRSAGPSARGSPVCSANMIGSAESEGTGGVPGLPGPVGVTAGGAPLPAPPLTVSPLPSPPPPLPQPCRIASSKIVTIRGRYFLVVGMGPDVKCVSNLFMKIPRVNNMSNNAVSQQWIAVPCGRSGAEKSSAAWTVCGFPGIGIVFAQQLTVRR